MIHVNKMLTTLRESNQASALNRWLGLKVEEAEPGQVVISMLSRLGGATPPRRLPAGIVGALLEAGCGFAAATLGSCQVLSSQFSVNYLKPALGEQFLVRAKVTKSSLNRIIAVAQVFLVTASAEEIIATGGAILTVCPACEPQLALAIV